MVLLTFVWKCFQDRNFHGAVVGLYEQSIESWVGLSRDKTFPDFFTSKWYPVFTEVYHLVPADHQVVPE